MWITLFILKPLGVLASIGGALRCYLDDVTMASCLRDIRPFFFLKKSKYTRGRNLVIKEQQCSVKLCASIIIIIIIMLLLLLLFRL
jgi:hypothetical protein